jgi:hypothetical protein
MRKYFHLVEDEPFTIELDNDDGTIEVIDFRDARVVAETGDLYTNIRDSVRIFDDIRLFRLTTVGDEDQTGSHGIFKGWYVARWISEEQARKLHKSWSVLSRQPFFSFPSTSTG